MNKNTDEKKPHRYNTVYGNAGWFILESGTPVAFTSWLAILFCMATQTPTIAFSKKSIVDLEYVPSGTLSLRLLATTF
jgi:hypothetical protein